jgi:hypothetical protein
LCARRSPFFWEISICRRRNIRQWNIRQWEFSTVTGIFDSRENSTMKRKIVWKSILFGKIRQWENYVISYRVLSSFVIVRLLYYKMSRRLLYIKCSWLCIMYMYIYWPMMDAKTRIYWVSIIIGIIMIQLRICVLSHIGSANFYLYVS